MNAPIVPIMEYRGEDIRNDLYITLQSAQFSSNINVYVEVKLIYDNCSEKCFSGYIEKGELMNNYTSALLCKVKQPNWNETFRVNSSKLDKAKLVFSFMYDMMRKNFNLNRKYTTNLKPIPFRVGILKLETEDGRILPDLKYTIPLYSVKDNKQNSSGTFQIGIHIYINYL